MSLPAQVAAVDPTFYSLLPLAAIDASSSSQSGMQTSAASLPVSIPVAISGTTRTASPSSRMRSHRGNRPSLPQSKQCPMCPAKFTRTTHLNRHLRTHTNERSHRCDICQAEFTRSDLLTRHRRSCGDPANQNKSRRKSCQACAESKVKCDLQEPCAKCIARGKECTYINDPKTSLEKKAASLARKQRKLVAAQNDSPESDASQGSPHPSSSGTDSAVASPEIPFMRDRSNSSLSLSSLSSETSSLYDSEYSSTTDIFFQGIDADLSSADVADTDMDFALDSDVERLDDSLSRLMADQHASGSGLISSTMQCFMPTSFEGWLGEDVPTPSLATIANMASFLGPPQLTTQPPVENTAAILDTDPYTVFPPLSTSRTLDMPLNLAVANLCATITLPSTLHHYLYMFHTAFLSHLPLLHMPTWSLKDKPDILVRAMQACGALFVKTQEANDFVSSTVEQTRDQLLQALAKTSNDFEEQLYLILAGLLLQAISLFRHNFEQRSSSNIYHGMLVMMIQRCGLITRCSEYRPPLLDGNSSQLTVEAAWKSWALHETIKRTLYLAYLHDTGHCVYYSLPPSFPHKELSWCLPVDEDIWRAGSSGEWFDKLQNASPYGDSSTRLTGFSVQAALKVLGNIHIMPIELPLSAFCHLVLIHALLADVYTSCGSAADLAKTNTFVLQNALHTWLHSWTHSPDTPDTKVGDARFFKNGLPYYWLAQVTLLVVAQAPHYFSLAPDVRYRVITRWAACIQRVVHDNEQAPTSLWLDLMAEAEAAEVSETSGLASHGVLSFFPIM